MARLHSCNVLHSAGTDRRLWQFSAQGEFAVQRELTANTVMELGYNASIGTHMQSGILNYNQVPTPVYNQLVSQYGVTQAQNILRANITSATAVAAGFRKPYSSFNGTVAQALRPFPQYTTISTGPQNGDKSGHSSYHAMVLKVDRRFSKGLTGQWNYVFSKLMTDSDTYFANSATPAMDQYNRRLEKSIGQFDQTHAIKLATLYDFPFGKGRRWIQGGFLDQVIGGWRVAFMQIYQSGTPIALTRNNPLPIFNGITRPQIDSYDNWRGPIAGDKFDPNVDKFLQPKTFFPVQPNTFGNATRYNPKVRAFWDMNENVSLAKTFAVKERLRIDLRGEAFNLLNRTVFGTGSTNLDSATFGLVTNQVNSPRQMQVALKVYW